ncbi:MAG: subclass B3 metallo-beta-lactamase [Pseudomonadota bacterium]
MPSSDIWLESCTANAGWDKPGPPFRIYGGSYYVGTCGIAAILITGDEGHILIDGGTKVGAGLIAKNIQSLGFALDDVKIMLHSHEHFDHVGGLSSLATMTGADVIASAAAAPVLQSGESAVDDPQAGMHAPFEPVNVKDIVSDGETVQLGQLRITAIATPGHTPGALSWSWHECTESGCKSIVYADSLSPISRDGYRFSDNPGYVSAFREGLSKLSDTPCDVLLTPHPISSQMHYRLSTSKFDDAASCSEFASHIGRWLDRRLADERVAE